MNITQIKYSLQKKIFLLLDTFCEINHNPIPLVPLAIHGAVQLCCRKYLSSVWIREGSIKHWCLGILAQCSDMLTRSCHKGTHTHSSTNKHTYKYIYITLNRNSACSYFICNHQINTVNFCHTNHIQSTQIICKGNSTISKSSSVPETKGSYVTHIWVLLLYGPTDVYHLSVETIEGVTLLGEFLYTRWSPLATTVVARQNLFENVVKFVSFVSQCALFVSTLDRRANNYTKTRPERIPGPVVTKTTSFVWDRHSHYTPEKVVRSSQDSYTRKAASS